MKPLFPLILMLLFSTAVLAQRKVVLSGDYCGFSTESKYQEFYVYDPDDEIRALVKKICDLVSVQPNFIIKRGPVDNAIALVDSNHNREIYYSQYFFRSLNSDAYKVAVLAHEIGHHLNNHLLSKSDRRPQDELEADRFAGSILCKMSIPLEAVNELLNFQCSEKATGAYPSRNERREAFAVGYSDAGCGKGSGATPLTNEFGPAFRLNAKESATTSTPHNLHIKPFEVKGLDVSGDFKIELKVRFYSHTKDVSPSAYGIALNYDEKKAADEQFLFIIEVFHSLLDCNCDSATIAYFDGILGKGRAAEPEIDPTYAVTLPSGNLLGFGLESDMGKRIRKTNGTKSFDVIRIEQNAKRLRIFINGAEMYGTREEKISSPLFGFFVYDGTEAALLSCAIVN
jgi:hypothetical protein